MAVEEVSIGGETGLEADAEFVFGDWSICMLDEFAASGLLSTRVCDSCIARKTKCDLKRPACSRCQSSGVRCIYTCVKKRPGPPKGSRRRQTTAPPKRREKNGNNSPQTWLHDESIGFDWAPTDLSPAVSLGSAAGSDPQLPYPSILLTDFHQSALESIVSPELTNSALAGHTVSNPTGTGITRPQFTPLQGSMLLQNFFLHLQATIPLFHEARFSQQHRAGKLSSDLVFAICAISAKIIGNCRSCSSEAVESSLDSLMNSEAFEKIPTVQSTLDDFQLAALLAFYELYERPGERSLKRIAHLTRKAYQRGLPQLDNPNRCSVFRYSECSEDELEDWRAVWWSLYYLDSFSNLLSGTPFLIEKESIQAALVSTAPITVSTALHESDKIFLPADCGLLPLSIRAIINHGGNVNRSIRILAVTLLREAGMLRRLMVQSPSESLRIRITALESHFTAIKDALPFGFMDATQQSALDASTGAYFDRLTSVLFIYFARVLAMIPSLAQADEAEWMYRWGRTLFFCEAAVGVASHWERSPSLIDPLVEIVFTGLLTMLELQTRLHTTTAAMKDLLEAQKQKLEFLLVRSVPGWRLGQQLLASFYKNFQAAGTQLAPDGIDRLLGAVAHGPLDEGTYFRLWDNGDYKQDNVWAQCLHNEAHFNTSTTQASYDAEMLLRF